MLDEQKEEIIQQYHNHSGQCLVNNMKFSNSQIYKWKSMYEDIANYCKWCKTCAKKSSEQVNTKNKAIESEQKNEL